MTVVGAALGGCSAGAFVVWVVGSGFGAEHLVEILRVVAEPQGLGCPCLSHAVSVSARERRTGPARR